MPRKGDYKPKLNLVGEKFGLLTVEKYAGYKRHPDNTLYHLWECKCDCGNTKITDTKSLRSGHCKSCGCIPSKPRFPKYKHNMTDSRLYNVWKSMKGRCYTKSCSAYKLYGGRGITVCDEWKNDFETFYYWAMQNGYKPGLTIDRIDVNGNYTPDNCRWADYYTQANNKTDTKYYEIDGKTLTLREASEVYNIPYKTLKGRIDSGHTITEAVYEVSNHKYDITFNGETHTIPEWSKITGIKKVTLYRRFNAGWSIENMLTKPVDNKKD